jgi:hypothetical protein
VASDAEVIFYQDTFRLWYTSSTNNKSGYPYPRVGYAWSLDEIHRQKHPDPVLVADTVGWTIEEGSIEGPSVIQDGDTLRMYYSAGMKMEISFHEKCL